MVNAIHKLGGVAAIAISHPHHFTTLVADNRGLSPVPSASWLAAECGRACARCAYLAWSFR